MAHPLFGPEVREFLEDNDTVGMKTFCETLHPATVAEALTDESTIDEAWRVLQQTSIKNQAAIFEYFPIDWQVKMVEGTGRQHMAKLIEQMSPDDRADLLRRLMPRVAEALLRLVDEADRRDIATLTRYAENTAGALMTTDYAWLPANITVSDALDRLRLQAPNSETIYYIYILDEHRKLLGVLSLRDVILAPRHTLIRDLMEKEMVSVRVTDDREKVAQEIGRYDLLAIPVVDEDHRLVGIVTHDDVMDVVVQEATEDVHLMGGVGPMEENYLEANFATIWRKRAFWLACLFGAELFTFTALSHFEDAIAEVVVLSLFVPLCISTGGNSGSQAATLITRAIALGQLSLGNWFKVLRHELLMGLALGVTLGLIAFFRGALTPEEIRKNPSVRREAFTVIVPSTEPLQIDERTHTVELPAGLEQRIVEDHHVSVTWPEDEQLQIHKEGNVVSYTFPRKCTLRHDAVDRWKLAYVISLAVAAICLWGTLVGSMLPILFKWRGIDPGIASSPFVATFVDVTGIIIYFTIATIFLL
jgi:magnesium transporter